MPDKLTLPICIEVQTSAESTLAYAGLANDFNPLHIDPDFAAKTSFGAPILHGSHTLALFVDLLERSMPDTLSVRDVNLRFVAPVPVGARVFLHLDRQDENPECLNLSADDGRGGGFAKGTAQLGPSHNGTDAKFNGAN